MYTKCEFSRSLYRRDLYTHPSTANTLGIPADALYSNLIIRERICTNPYNNNYKL